MTAAAATKPDRRRLAHLLRAAHSPLDPDGVTELVAGVLAAPEEIGASWHRLVAEPTPPALAEALEELRAHMAAGYHDGLSREDERLRSGAERAAASLRPVENAVDEAWSGRPPAPIAPVVPHPERYAGESAEAKRARLARSLAKEGAAAVVLTMPESIAWLLNIRGGDVPHTPLPLSFAILRQDGSVNLFIDRRKVVPGLDRHLGNAVTIEPPDGLGPALDALAASGERVKVDPGTASSL